LNPNTEFRRKKFLNKLKAFSGRIDKSVTMDVTGGMYGKVAELIPALERGVEVKIINGMKANRLYRALTDQEVEGTKIEP